MNANNETDTQKLSTKICYLFISIKIIFEIWPVWLMVLQVGHIYTIFAWLFLCAYFLLCIISISLLSLCMLLFRFFYFILFHSILFNSFQSIVSSSRVDSFHSSCARLCILVRQQQAEILYSVFLWIIIAVCYFHCWSTRAMCGIVLLAARHTKYCYYHHNNSWKVENHFIRSFRQQMDDANDNANEIQQCLRIFTQTHSTTSWIHQLFIYTCIMHILKIISWNWVNCLNLTSFRSIFPKWMWKYQTEKKETTTTKTGAIAISQIFSMQSRTC